MICPRCQQDELLLVKIKNRGELVVCPECEATWMNPPDATGIGFRQLDDFLDEWGLVNDWSKFEYQKFSQKN
jgi:transcription elongation factor Elf1